MQSHVLRTLFTLFLVACLASLASAVSINVHPDPREPLSPRVIYDLKDEGSVLDPDQSATLANSTANLNSTASRDSQSSASGAIANAGPAGRSASALAVFAVGGVLVYGLEVAMVLMDAGQLIGLSIFASYFLLILALFLRIATSLRWRNVGWSPRVFLALTAGAFAHTWYYMFRFMSWSFRNYEHALETSQAALPTHLRIANWLCNIGLFEQAWVAVCFGPTPWSWWWSQQLCLFTAGAWTTFLTLEGRRRGVRHLWAYALLGQLVAISASIGWDVVWTTGTVLVWRASQRGDVWDVTRAAAGVAGDVVRVCLGSVGVLGLATVRSERWGKDE
ncbi:hypothetical protein PHLGIDRAFT_36535 [Phlebiopsis gigantea 11061_1 CR5-6]|uniref:Uncharacterized protein n=1 Tax=Phlebiopsis gigantea (strain 11061_1 CR5-6) TaxID=745531 RepID=A0A0C3RVD4_PHLG1|nr:hypothetical protein PHLGIDRAFT_36535 [Phlebiopsis gigantea 11061_1 CR5-6]